MTLAGMVAHKMTRPTFLSWPHIRKTICVPKTTKFRTVTVWRTWTSLNKT